jgi:acyl-CoA synthetase (AMP-forming)/AMP-acid ligase II
VTRTRHVCNTRDETFLILDEREEKIICTDTTGIANEYLSTQAAMTTTSFKSRLVEHLSPEEKELRFASSHYGPTSWQVSALHILHSHGFQIALMALMMADVLSLFAELYIEAEFPACRQVERDAVCIDSDYVATCDENKRPMVDTIVGGLDVLSLSIL